jgi:hypothetical protein
MIMILWLFAPRADAHIVVNDPLKEHLSIKNQMKLVKKNLYHGRGVMRAVKKQNKISNNEWEMFLNHRWLYNRASHRLEMLRAKLENQGRPPHYREWLCIKSHEASWDNPGIDWLGRPSGYYGGLQMDMQFQSLYGSELLKRKGTANNWTPLEQMWVAEKAWKTRGFTPWPNTARECGLL